MHVFDNLAGKSASREEARRLRVGSWAERVFSALAVVFALALLFWLLGYRLGILGILVATPAVIATVLLNRRSRRRQKRRPSESWKRGAEGERRTAQQLHRLASHSWVVYHDLGMGRQSANIDHLVVGPTGIFVLDSKNWNGKARYDEHIDDWLYGKKLSSMADVTLAERDWLTSQIEAPLREYNVPIFTAWVMTGTRQIVASVNGVNIVPVDRVANWIASQPTVLENWQVNEIVACLRLVVSSR